MRVVVLRRRHRRPRLSRADRRGRAATRGRAADARPALHRRARQDRRRARRARRHPVPRPSRPGRCAVGSVTGTAQGGLKLLGRRRSRPIASSALSPRRRLRDRRLRQRRRRPRRRACASCRCSLFLPDVEAGLAVRTLARVATASPSRSRRPQARDAAREDGAHRLPGAPRLLRGRPRGRARALRPRPALPTCSSSGASTGATDQPGGRRPGCADFLRIGQLIHLCGRNDEAWLAAQRDDLPDGPAGALSPARLPPRGMAARPRRRRPRRHALRRLDARRAAGGRPAGHPRPRRVRGWTRAATPATSSTKAPPSCCRSRASTSSRRRSRPAGGHAASQRCARSSRARSTGCRGQLAALVMEMAGVAMVRAATIAASAR